MQGRTRTQVALYAELTYRYMDVKISGYVCYRLGSLPCFAPPCFALYLGQAADTQDRLTYHPAALPCASVCVYEPVCLMPPAAPGLPRAESSNPAKMNARLTRANQETGG